MSGVWFTADTHFGHAKVAGIRGFDNTDDHDAAIIAAWKTQVKPGDTVWVLGDISGGQTQDHALDVLKSLPGDKHLIAGNHDSVSSIHRNGFKHQAKFLTAFDSVQNFGVVKMAGHHVSMSHFPFASQGDGRGRGAGRHMAFRLPDVGQMLIHGHTHDSDPTAGSVTGRELCVSWDAWGRLAGQGDVAKWVAGLDKLPARQ